MTENGPRARPHSVGQTSVSRRLFLKGSGGVALAGVLAPLLFEGTAFAALGSGTTPEQVHLQWGSDPTSGVVISWAAPTAEPNPVVNYGTSPLLLNSSVVPVLKTYTDGISGEEVFTYHATLTGLAAATPYSYQISDGGSPVGTFPASGVASFTTAPEGRAPFVFTSYGDLGTPGLPFSSAQWGESQYNAYYAVNEVETLAPLFHLMNGDLCYADKNQTSQAEVWRDFGLNVQRSAANRPWMPCIGNHEVELGVTQYSRSGSPSNENGIVLAGSGAVYASGTYQQFANGKYGQASYLTRFTLPDNGTGSPSSGGFSGSFYSFRVGSVFFISLDANDVAYQDSGAFTATAQATPSGTTIPANTGVYNRQYTGPLGTPNEDSTIPPGSNVQTQWLATTLETAAADTTIDWIIVQMHQTALSSSHDNGSDLGIREAWLPLFDQYQVDLVLCGHDHDYERSFPVRGFNHNQGTGITGSGSGFERSGQTGVETLQPNPVVTDPTVTTFDTSKGTVHLVLGGGGTDKPDNTYGGYGTTTTVGGRSVHAAGVNTYTNPKIVAASNKGVPDTWEPAIWSAMTDATDAYGIASFTVNPGTVAGGTTTLTMQYLHAPSTPTGAQTTTPPNPGYTVLETITFTRPRSDGTNPVRTAGPPVETPEFSNPVLAVAAASAVAGGALYLSTRHRSAHTQAAGHPLNN
jgi:Purple acid Phosphatase, N-terminal domain/Calcineurin-like phosphoesterase